MKKLLVSSFAFLPALSFAHAGHDGITMSEGFTAGLLHPVMGIDHLFALVALGLLLYKLSTKHAVFMGGAFLSLMALGFYGAQSGLLHLASSTVEGLIFMSVGVSAVLLALYRMVNAQLSSLALLAFAVFHGMAHGVEVPVEVSAHGFALGFLVACAAIMAVSRLLLKGLVNLRGQSQVVS